MLWIVNNKRRTNLFGLEGRNIVQMCCGLVYFAQCFLALAIGSVRVRSLDGQSSGMGESAKSGRCAKGNSKKVVGRVGRLFVVGVVHLLVFCGLFYVP